MGDVYENETSQIHYNGFKFYFIEIPSSDKTVKITFQWVQILFYKRVFVLPVPSSYKGVKITIRGAFCKKKKLFKGNENIVC